MLSMQDLRWRAGKALEQGSALAGKALEKAQSAWTDSAATRAAIADKLQEAAEGVGEYAEQFRGRDKLDPEKVQRLAEAIVQARLLEFDEAGNPDPIDPEEALALAIVLAKKYEGIEDDTSTEAAA